MFPSLKTVTYAMLVPPLHLRYFISLPFIYLRLSSIPSSFIFSNISWCPPLARPWEKWGTSPALREPKAKQRRYLGNKCPESHVLGPDQSLGRVPREPRGGRMVPGWLGAEAERLPWGETASQTSQSCLLSWSYDFTFLCLLMCPLSDSCLSFPHFVDNVVGLIRGLWWTHEGRMGRTAFPSHLPLKRNFRARSGHSAGKSFHTPDWSLTSM